LNDTLAYARAESPFYRARGDWPATPLATLDDIVRLPFTTPADVLRADPPLAAISQAAAQRVVTLPTSGTSGPPKRLFFTAADQESTIDF
ncbi:hypothetical protein J8J40_28355, partial [Mycobacterium tuberculosis]|nr:hypothetical protein [Mycobacterium tuberculosis]